MPTYYSSLFGLNNLKFCYKIFIPKIKFDSLFQISLSLYLLLGVHVQVYYPNMYRKNCPLKIVKSNGQYFRQISVHCALNPTVCACLCVCGVCVCVCVCVSERMYVLVSTCMIQCVSWPYTS